MSMKDEGWTSWLYPPPPPSFLCSCYKVSQQRVKLTTKQNIQLAARSKSQDTNELFAFLLHLINQSNQSLVE